MKKLIITGYQICMSVLITLIWVLLGIQGTPAKWDAPQWSIMGLLTFMVVIIVVGIEMIKRDAKKEIKKASSEL